MVKDYLSKIFGGIEEIKAIYETIQSEFERADCYTDKIFNDMFLYNLDEDGCRRYEKMLKIIPLTTDSLEDRRFRIISIFKGDTPYTITSLYNKLSEMCGAENISIDLDAESYRIIILLGLERKSQYNDALELINKMLPCNLELFFSLKYTPHEMLTKYTHEQLSAYTHERIMEEIILQEGQNGELYYKLQLRKTVGK